MSFLFWNITVTYTKRTCSQCGIRDIQPNMVRKTIKVESGHSKRSLSPLTFLELVVSDKKSIGAVKERIFNSNQRTYYRSREVWLCAECSGVAANRRKELEQVDKRRLNDIRKKEIAAEKEARRVEAERLRAEVRRLDDIRKREIIDEKEALRVKVERLRAEEKISTEILRSDAHNRTKREKEALKNLAKIASDQQATASKRSEEAVLHFSEVSKSDVTNDAEARKIKIALRKRPLLFVRALVESTVISFVLIFMGVFIQIKFSNYDLSVKIISFALIGLPIYTVAAYKIRARRTLAERRRLVQEFREVTESVSSKSSASIASETESSISNAVTTRARESVVPATNVTLNFQISNGDTYETDEISIQLVLSDSISAEWLSKLKTELSDDNLCGFMRHIYGNPDYDCSEHLGECYNLILKRLSQEVYRNRGWLDARATPNGIKIGKKTIDLDDDKKEALYPVMIQLSPDGYMHIA